MATGKASNAVVRTGSYKLSPESAAYPGGISQRVALCKPSVETTQITDTPSFVVDVDADVSAWGKELSPSAHRNAKMGNKIGILGA